MGIEPANDNEGPFSIDQTACWPGLSKLIEECGEVVQIVGKLIATGGRTDHWSGLDLKHELEDELADLLAAMEFVWDHNDLDRGRMAQRTHRKNALFEEWHGKSRPGAAGSDTTCVPGRLGDDPIGAQRDAHA